MKGICLRVTHLALVDYLLIHYLLVTHCSVASSEFITYLLEQLSPLGDVRARSMFGGFGIYRGERMFALVAEDALYIKVDDVNRREFEARGLLPFRYEMRGKRGTLSYWQAPPDALDDREMLCEWARKGCEAADRALKTKSRATLSQT